MNDLPEPTRKESLALVLGAGGFWLAFALAVPLLFILENPVGALPFVLGLASGTWLYFGGCFHIVARSQGISVWRVYPGKSISWLGALTPDYFRRAIVQLRWPVVPVFVALATLLVVDLALFVVMLVTAPV